MTGSPRITLVSVFSSDYLGHVSALFKTQQALPVPSEILVIVGDGMSFSSTQRVVYDNRLSDPGSEGYINAYQDIILNGLPKLITTDFVLTVHNDGYARNPDRWTDDFLEYDYIGAPWVTKAGNFRVGNGGFSLRSRKFLRGQLACPPRGELWEDTHLCGHCRPFLEGLGCKFAPVEMALRFSIEHPVADFPNWSPRDSFGFHQDKRPISEQYPQ